MSEKIIILGAGRQGTTAAEFLRKNNINAVLADKNPDNLTYAQMKGFKVFNTDLSDESSYSSIFNSYNLAVSALPARLGKLAQEQAVKYRKNIVDVSYSEDDPFILDEKAKQAGVFILPDAGIAPGTSNLLAGRIYSELEDKEQIRIFVGGIQERNIPPLGYALTWSPEDLIAEYTRPARIRSKGKEITVDALSGLEDFEWAGMEPLESFYTDGLRTLLRTLSDVPDLDEKTVRYKGHTDKILFLRQMGFLNEKCCNMKPMETTLHLMSHMDTQGTYDVLLMRITGTGIKNGNRIRISYDVFDKGNDEHSAMERTTGFSLGMFSIIGLELGSGFTGVIAPEMLGMDEYVFPRAIELLDNAGIKVQRTEQIISS